MPSHHICDHTVTQTVSPHQLPSSLHSHVITPALRHHYTHMSPHQPFVITTHTCHHTNPSSSNQLLSPHTYHHTSPPSPHTCHYTRHPSPHQPSVTTPALPSPHICHHTSHSSPHMSRHHTSLPSPHTCHHTMSPHQPAGNCHQQFLIITTI